MPACDSVIEVNTPIAYSGMSASTRPPKATTTTIESTASATIPVLNASRSPRKAKRARHVAIASQQRRQPREVGEGGVRGEDKDAHRRELKNVVGDPVPKTARPICEMTVSCSVGTAPADAGEVRRAEEHDPDEHAHDA